MSEYCQNCKAVTNERDHLREVNRELVAVLEAMCNNMALDGGQYRDCFKRSHAVLAKAKEAPWNTQSTTVLPARSSSPNAVMK